MLIDSQGCRNIAIVLVLFVERVRVSLDLSFVAKLAKTQDFFSTPPVLGSVLNSTDATIGGVHD